MFIFFNVGVLMLVLLRRTSFSWTPSKTYISSSFYKLQLQVFPLCGCWWGSFVSCSVFPESNIISPDITVKTTLCKRWQCRERKDAIIYTNVVYAIARHLCLFKPSLCRRLHRFQHSRKNKPVYKQHLTFFIPLRAKQLEE